MHIGTNVDTSAIARRSGWQSRGARLAPGVWAKRAGPLRTEFQRTGYLKIGGHGLLGKACW